MRPEARTHDTERCARIREEALFAVLAAGLRGSRRTARIVTGASLALYLLPILVAGPDGFGFYLTRAVYLAMTGYLVGFLGQQHASSTRTCRISRGGCTTATRRPSPGSIFASRPGGSSAAATRPNAPSRKVFQKLGVRDRVEIARLAIRTGLVGADEEIR